MTDENTPTPEPHELSEAQLRSIVGEEVDTRIGALTESLDTRLAKMDILDGLEGLFEKHKSEPTDSKGLLGEIESLIDRKLATLGETRRTENSGRRIGPLGRFLAGNSN